MFQRVKNWAFGDTGAAWSCWFNWLVLGISAVVIFCCALEYVHPSCPGSANCRWGFTVDFAKFIVLGHVAAFGWLGIWFYRGLTRCAQPSPVWSALLTLTSGVCFGLLIEVVQPFFGRTCDIADLIPDVLGVVLAVLLWEVFRCSVDRKASPSCCLRLLI